jgi:serine/threonine protein kinase
LAQNRASNILLDSEQHKKLDQHALDLLARMLKKNPQERITAEQALNHAYFGESQEETDE